MAYGAAADDENLLGYSASKPPAPVSESVAVPLAPPVPNPLAGEAAPFSAERADLIVSFLRASWEGCRPWGDFYSTRVFNRPAFDALSDRVRTNLAAFQNNYIIVATGWLALAVLARIPTFLLAGMLFFLLDKGATYRAAKNEGVLSHEDRIVVSVLGLVIVWFTGIFWHVWLSLFCPGVFVLAHAACHRTTEVVEVVDGV